MLQHPAGNRTHAHDTPRYTDDGRVVRHRMNDNGTGADLHVIADPDAAEYFRARSNDDVVADRGMALAVFITRASQRYPLVEKHIVADFGGFADHHAHAVVDEKTAADGRARMYFNARQKSGYLRDETRQKRNVRLV